MTSPTRAGRLDRLARRVHPLLDWLPSRSLHGVSAYEQMTFVAGGFVGTCVLIYLLILVPMITEEAPHTPAWTALAVGAELASSLLVLTALFRRRARDLRRAMIGFTVLYFCMESAWRPLWDGSRFAPGEWQWHCAYTAMGTIAVVPFLRTRAVWLVHTGSVLLFQASTIGVSQTPFFSRLLVSWLIAGFAVGVAVILFSMARERDAEEEAARVQAAATGAAEAMEIERERVDGLIHDSVMSTLLVASRVDDPASVAAAARRTLDQLADLRTRRDPNRELTPQAFQGLLVSSISFVDPAADVQLAPTAEAPSPYPGAPARAVVAAATEAARNCALHAPGARHEVWVELGERSLGVTVTDDGPGFDPTRVPPNRMGVRSSILARVNGLDGGSAQVRSAPGHGTVITLRWRQ